VKRGPWSSLDQSPRGDIPHKSPLFVVFYILYFVEIVSVTHQEGGSLHG